MISSEDEIDGLRKQLANIKDEFMLVLNSQSIHHHQHQVALFLTSSFGLQFSLELKTLNCRLKRNISDPSRRQTSKSGMKNIFNFRFTAWVRRTRKTLFLKFPKNATDTFESMHAVK
jgi:hypothetical protein